MAAYIELQRGDAFPTRISVKPGDLLAFPASGSRVLSHPASVEVLGAFVTGVLGTNMEVLTAMGPPNLVLIRACQAGSSRVEVMTGDPFHSVKSAVVEIVVEG